MCVYIYIRHRALHDGVCDKLISPWGVWFVLKIVFRGSDGIRAGLRAPWVHPPRVPGPGSRVPHAVV